jgi:thioredoxin reductase (NADPH)
MKKLILSFLFALTLPTQQLLAKESYVEPVVLLGGGVGSLTSALYLGRAGLSPLVIEGPNPGGLLVQSHSVQNWPGEMEIEGVKLTERMREQAAASGARFLSEEVIAVDFSKRPLIITTKALDGSNKTRQIQTESCIIAIGTTPNFLGIAGEQKYWGKGVTNCAVCDGSLYKDKVVGVVGGGDAAVLEALYLSNIAKEVHVFVRKDSLRAIEERRVEALRQKENVKFVFETTVEEVRGDEHKVTGVVLKNGSKKRPFALDGLFLAIGSTPNTKLFKNVLKLDEKGYIRLEKDQQTSIAGVYAIGDIVDPVYKQAISAAGDGAKAALQVQQFVSDRINHLAKAPLKESGSMMASNQGSCVIEIQSEDELQSELESSVNPVVVDFYAPWCGPCKRVAPIIDNASNLLAGKIKFLKVNLDNIPNLTSAYAIKGMPTVLLLDPSGEELERKMGFDQINQLLQKLQEQY